MAMCLFENGEKRVGVSKVLVCVDVFFIEFVLCAVFIFLNNHKQWAMDSDFYYKSLLTE